MFRRGFATKKQAQGELDEVRRQDRTNRYVAPAKLTVKEYLQQWVAGLPTTGLRPSTIDGYPRNMDHGRHFMASPRTAPACDQRKRRRCLVPGAGLEPARPCGQWCLRPSRLPVPPSGRALDQRFCSLAHPPPGRPVEDHPGRCHRAGVQITPTGRWTQSVWLDDPPQDRSPERIDPESTAGPLTWSSCGMAQVAAPPDAQLGRRTWTPSHSPGHAGNQKYEGGIVAPAHHAQRTASAQGRIRCTSPNSCHK